MSPSLLLLLVDAAACVPYDRGLVTEWITKSRATRAKAAPSPRVYNDPQRQSWGAGILKIPNFNPTG